MADTDKNPVILEVVSSEQLTDTELVQATNVDGQVDVTDEDMLSQALVDVSEYPDGVQIHYSEDGVDLQEGTLITSHNDGVTYITSENIDQVSGDQLSEQFVNGTYQVLATGGVVGEGDYGAELNEEMSLTSSSQVEGDAESGLGFQKIENNTMMCTVQSTNIADTAESIKPVMAIAQGTTVSITGAAPLGSSQNPIRIIQQGNQYTPVQQLSTDQLQQIMQVVQQQQMTSTLESGSSVLFNPQTNTRIVYRVIYPSELHKDSVAVSNSMQTVNSMQTTPRKMYRKRSKEDDPELRDGPSLTKEEKEVRKKARSKTRSGRVSKPPKHMVKDFKHIHVLDYDEDYDDSDGGYSDYKVGASEEDEEASRKEDNDSYIVPGLNSIKPKNWKCVTCEKAYIGRAGLGRHLKLNPTHGSIDLEGDGDMIPPPPGSEIIMNGTSSTPDNTPSLATSNGTSNGIGTANSTASFSEDSRDSSYSLPYTPTPSRPRGSNPRGRPRGTRGWRGRGAYSKVDPEIRRQNRLKDLVKECTDEELMEIVLPRLAKVITLWEFLLMKVEKGDPAKPHADDVYTEYEKLHQYVKKLCQEYLQFIPEADVQNDVKVLQVENNAVAEALGLKTGAHKVKEISDTDASVTYKYKFLTTNHSVDFAYANKSFLKRTVEVVSPEQIVSPAKKMKNGPLKVEILQSPVKTSALTNVQSIGLSVTSQSASSQSPVIVQSSTGNTSLMSQSNTNTTTIISNNLHSNLKNHQTNTSYPKVVSLLSNSLLKKGTAPIQQKQPQTSQKFIIVSGMNSSPDITDGTGHQPQSIILEGNQSNIVGKTGEEATYFLSTMPSLEPKTDNTDNSKNLAATNKDLLPSGLVDSVSIQTPIVPQSNVLPTNSSDSIQQMYFTVPLSSSQTSLISSDIEMNTKSPVVSEISNQNESNVIDSPVTQDSANATEMVNVDQELNQEFSETSAMITNDLTQEPSDKPHEMLTNQSGEFTGLNGNQVSFTVHSDSMLNDRKSQNETHDSMTDDQVMNEQGCDFDATNRSNDIIGVNSIDTSESNGKIKQETLDVECDSQLGTDYTGVKYVNDTSEPSMNDNLEPTQGELYQYEEETGEPDQVETIQIPANNIFQTEDGAIFIQNHDGTFIQLQSADGQNVSMETVQALLANEGDTQFIAGQDENCQLEQT